MLKLFRRIRHTLLEQGRFKNYTIYAIGEILLVVIGILIALQINNWNEQRVEKNLENEILAEICDALKDDLISVEFCLSSHSQVLASQSILIEWIQGKAPYHDSLDFHFASASRATHALLKQGPYEALKEMGIHIIKNDSIRIHIQNLYDFTYEWYEKNSAKYKEDANDMVKNINMKFFSNPIIEGATLVDYKIQMKPLNVNEIQTDNEYLYTIQVNADFNRFLMRVNMEPTISEIKKLIQLIELELSK